ncbi:hypothetical protein [Serratia ficaria]|uniref:hypothetical protein n=1 Tax=Serratia ficaria TaxID=61651 RepID=UPI0036F2F6AF
MQSVLVAAAARELCLYESQLYTWHSKQQQQLTSSERKSELATENVRLKRPLAEQDKELAILQNVAANLYNALKLLYIFRKISGRVQRQSHVSGTTGCPQRLVCLVSASSSARLAPAVPAHM